MVGRKAILVLAMTGGCATTNRGELAVEIETPTPIEYVQIAHVRTGETAEIGNIPAGMSSHAERLRLGIWCVTKFSDALGSVSRSYRPQSSICRDVALEPRRPLRLLRRGNALLVASDNGPKGGVLMIESAEPGALSRKQILATVAPTFPDLRECFAQAPLAPGRRVVIHAVVEANGDVSRAQLLPPHDSAEFSRCLTARIEALRFPGSQLEEQDVLIPFP
jgi:hypothetical protein